VERDRSAAKHLPNACSNARRTVLDSLCRNSDLDDSLIVLTEGRGTCSAKHALMRRLAVEQELKIALMVGIYKMTEAKTPGAGRVLSKYQLLALMRIAIFARGGSISQLWLAGMASIAGYPQKLALYHSFMDDSGCSAGVACPRGQGSMDEMAALAFANSSTRRHL